MIWLILFGITQAGKENKNNENVKFTDADTP